MGGDLTTLAEIGEGLNMTYVWYYQAGNPQINVLKIVFFLIDEKYVFKISTVERVKGPFSMADCDQDSMRKKQTIRHLDQRFFRPREEILSLWYHVLSYRTALWPL